MPTVTCSVELLITCVYVNQTSKIQVVRIENVAEPCFERTVFPGQQVVIETTAEAVLDIYGGSMMSMLLDDRVPCRELPRLLTQSAASTASKQCCLPAA